MRIVVQKFGGTSVATEEGRRRVADKILAARDAGMRPVVVISAMGRHPEPYATDSLLGLVKPHADQHDAREADLLAACGEIIACVVVSHFLRSRGIPASAFSGPQAGLRTDASFGEGRIRSIDPSRLLQALDRGETPVVAGFQGATEDGDVVTLGRGGSDTTAVALGAALGAEVEIYTDVEGVMTADPRMVSDARVLAAITFQEVGEMANEGARVVHPRAVEMAEAHGVPMVVRSTFSGAPGTHIVDRPTAEGQMATGVVTVGGLSRVRVDFEGVEDVCAARGRLFEELAAAGVSLDLINLMVKRLYFIVRTEALPTAVLDRLGFPYEVRQGCAKVSVIGQGMRGVPGVMFRIHRALTAAGVDLLHSTDSHITISCLVPDEDLGRAAEALHREFGLQG